MIRNLWWGPPVGTLRSKHRNSSVSRNRNLSNFQIRPLRKQSCNVQGGKASNTGTIKARNKTHGQYATRRTQWRLFRTWHWTSEFYTRGGERDLIDEWLLASQEWPCSMQLVDMIQFTYNIHPMSKYYELWMTICQITTEADAFYVSTSVHHWLQNIVNFKCFQYYNYILFKLLKYFNFFCKLCKVPVITGCLWRWPIKAQNVLDSMII
jgi:hypothetical protein